MREITPNHTLGILKSTKSSSSPTAVFPPGSPPRRFRLLDPKRSCCLALAPEGSVGSLTLKLHTTRAVPGCKKKWIKPSAFHNELATLVSILWFLSPARHMDWDSYETPKECSHLLPHCWSRSSPGSHQLQEGTDLELFDPAAIVS